MRVKMVPIKTEAVAKQVDFVQIERQLLDAMTDRPDVLVLSEMWNTGFDMLQVRAYADATQQCKSFLSGFASAHDVNIIGGSVAVLEAGKLFNRSMVFDRSGALLHQYDKWHLFSYAAEHEHFTPGLENHTFELEGMRCAVIICYDLRFGEQILALRKQGAEVLFIPAAWPSARIEHWQILLRSRAIEFQLYVIGVNDALYGSSAIYDPLGQELIEEPVELKRSTLEVRNTFPVFGDRKARY